jgi:hypothetical protein
MNQLGPLGHWDRGWHTRPLRKFLMMSLKEHKKLHFFVTIWRKRKQYRVLSLPDIIKIFEAPLCGIFSGFIEQWFWSPHSPDFTPLSIYFYNITLQHPVALHRSDFAFCFYAVYVQLQLIPSRFLCTDTTCFGLIDYRQVYRLWWLRSLLFTVMLFCFPYVIAPD